MSLGLDVKNNYTFQIFSKFTGFSIAGFLLASFIGCTSEKQVEQIIEKKPEIIFNAMEKNPEKFIKAFQTSLQAAQKFLQEEEKKRAQEEMNREEKELEESFDKPLQVVIGPNEVIHGPVDAPITLVAFSDFECPFCQRGFNTVNEVIKAYPGKVRYIYKHFPLQNHPNGLLASQYFEAIRKQNPKKSIEFHDLVYQEQGKLRSGKPFLNSLVKKLALDLQKLEKDLEDPSIMKVIEAHIEEADSFGIRGTPGFVLNGVPIKGAYPFPRFKMILDKLQEKGYLKL